MENFFEFKRCPTCKEMVRAELKTIGKSTEYVKFPDKIFTAYGNCPKCGVAIKTDINKSMSK